MCQVSFSLVGLSDRLPAPPIEGPHEFWRNVGFNFFFFFLARLAIFILGENETHSTRQKPKFDTFFVMF